LAVQPDGRILVAYYYYASIGSTQLKQGVVRLNGDGTPDTSFGGDGAVQVDLGDVPAVGVGVDGEGRVLIGSMEHKVARLTPTGEPDASFGTNGIATAALPPAAVPRAYTMVVLPDGRPLIGGTSDETQAGARLTLARFTVQGVPDPSFGDGGVVLRDVPQGNFDRVEKLALRPSGTPVALLNLVAPGDSFGDAHLARLADDGSFDATFGPAGSGGVVDANGERRIAGWAVAVDDQDRVVVGGYYSGAFVGFVRRFTPAGLPDPTFGHDGAAVPAQAVTELCLDPGGDVVFGLWHSNPGALYRLLGRPLGDGPAALEDGVLQITGRRNDDVLTLSEGGDVLTVTLNGSSYPFPAEAVQRVNVIFREGHDQATIDVGDALAADIDVQAGDGDELVTVASAPFEREVTVTGGAGGERVTVLDGATARVFFDGQSFSNVQYVELHTGDGDDVVTGTFQDVSGGGSVIRTTSSKHVRLGAGDDVVNITSGTFSLVEGQDGDDTVNLFGGTCGFDGGAGYDRAIVHGTADADSFTVNGSNAGRGNSLVAMPVCELVALRGFDGVDAFTVSTGPSTVGVIELDGGAGDDAFTVGSSQNFAVPRAPLRVLGGAGANTLLVNNAADGNTPDVLTLNATGVAALPTDSFFAPGVSLRYEDVDTLTLNTGRLADAVRVAPSATTAFVINAGLPDASPGDRLTVDTAGTTDPQHAPGAPGAGQFTFANRRPIMYTGFEEAAAVAGPLVQAGAFAVEPRQSVRFDFAGPFAASPAPTPAAFELVNLASGASVDPSAMVVSPDPAAGTLEFRFPGLTYGALPDGRYRATLRAGAVTDPAGNPLASDFAFELFFLNGDANRDGVVNLRDFNVLASNFGTSDRTFTQGDFNYDTVVNLADFNLLAGRFGHVVGPHTSSTSSFNNTWDRERVFDLAGDDEIA
jgi:uncharacterized delta-60 repeat protein